MWAIVSRLHIVAIALLGCFTFGWLLTGRYPWLAAGVTALDWFVVNLLNRVVDVEEDRINQVTGADWADRHRRALVGVGLALLLGSLVAVHLVCPALLPLRLAGHALALSYNWPLLPGWRRLKQLYLVKNLASGTGFLITVFGYPLAVAGWSLAGAPADVSWATVGAAIGFFLPFELSYEVVYDLRDQPGDRAAGVRTFPVVHGERGAARIIDGLLAGSLAVLVVGGAAGVVPWRLFIMGAAPLLQLVLYKRAVRRGVTARDCIAITWLGAGLLLTWHLWILADLPGARL